MRLRKFGATAAVLMAVGSAVVAGAGTASADIVATKYISDSCDIDGCGQGDLIMNYHSVAKSGEGNPSGSSAFFHGNIWSQGYEDVPTRGTNTFIRYVYVYAAGGGDGSGQAVKNNAASANNCSTVDGYRVYFSSGYAGHSQFISHVYGCSGSFNLDSTLKNNNASSHFA